MSSLSRSYLIESCGMLHSEEHLQANPQISMAMVTNEIHAALLRDMYNTHLSKRRCVSCISRLSLIGGSRAIGVYCRVFNLKRNEPRGR